MLPSLEVRPEIIDPVKLHITVQAVVLNDDTFIVVFPLLVPLQFLRPTRLEEADVALEPLYLEVGRLDVLLQVFLVKERGAARVAAVISDLAVDRIDVQLEASLEGKLLPALGTAVVLLVLVVPPDVAQQVARPARLVRAELALVSLYLEVLFARFDPF